MFNFRGMDDYQRSVNFQRRRGFVDDVSPHVKSGIETELYFPVQLPSGNISL